MVTRLSKICINLVVSDSTLAGNAERTPGSRRQSTTTRLFAVSNYPTDNDLTTARGVTPCNGTQQPLCARGSRVEALSCFDGGAPAAGQSLRARETRSLACESCTLEPQRTFGKTSLCRVLPQLRTPTGGLQWKISGSIKEKCPTAS
jgi:hypothetical protein